MAGMIIPTIGGAAVAGAITYLLHEPDGSTIRFRTLREVRQALARQTWTTMGKDPTVTKQLPSKGGTGTVEKKLTQKEYDLLTGSRPSRGRGPGRPSSRRAQLPPIGNREPPRPQRTRLESTLKHLEHDMHASMPAALAEVVSQSNPRFVSTRRKNAICVEHTEFLGSGTTSGSVNFESNSFTINPQNSNTFAWLSGIASNFEKYYFRWIKVRYIPRTGTTTEGTVLIAPEYDVNDPAPSSEAALFSMVGAREAPPYTGFTVDMPASSLHSKGPLYCRGHVRAADNRLSDAAEVYVATVGMTGATEVGRCVISYCCELIDPHEEEPSTALVPSQAIVSYTYYASQALTATAITMPLAPLPISAPYPATGVTPTGELTLPSGCWHTSLLVDWTSADVAGQCGFSLEPKFTGTWAGGVANGDYTGETWGTAAVADPGGAAGGGILINPVNASDGDGTWNQIRVHAKANTAITLTNLYIHLVIWPA